MEFQLRDVHYQYTGRHHTVHAVRGVTATFETGKLSVIMGKSGSGKTTLLSMLAGLLLPTSGTVLLDGNAMENMDRNRLRRERISVIYQDFNLFPLLTVEENAAYSLIIQGRPQGAGAGACPAKIAVCGHFPLPVPPPTRHFVRR